MVCILNGLAHNIGWDMLLDFKNLSEIEELAMQVLGSLRSLFISSCSMSYVQLPMSIAHFHLNTLSSIIVALFGNIFSYLATS